MAEEGMGPCERAWREHFPHAEMVFLRRDCSLLPAGEAPQVLLPSWYDAYDREKAFAHAILRRYIVMFGVEALVEAVGVQHRIPEGLALICPDPYRRNDCAAD